MNLLLKKCAGFLLLGVAVLTPQTSRAQCMLGPVSLPGLSGPPEWTDFNSDAFWRPELHDPRWSGAPIQYLDHDGVGALQTDEMPYRILADGKVVYLSLQANSDDAGPEATDLIYVAFSEGSGNGAYVVKLDLANAGTSITAPADPDGGGPVVVPQDSPLPKVMDEGDISYWHTADASVPSPAWGSVQAGYPCPSAGSCSVTNTFLAAARWDRPSGSPRWAVTLKIDFSSTGLNTSGATKFFIGTHIHKTASFVNLANVLAATTAATRVGDTLTPKSSASWVTYPEPGSACAGGITLSPGDVGVWTGTPGTMGGGSLTNNICTSASSSSCPGTENVFRVTIRNVPNPPGNIPDWSLRARVRVAAWGSNVSYWNFAPWKDFEVVNGKTGTNIMTESSGQFTNDGSGHGWYWQTAGSGPSDVTIDYGCNKGTDPYCPKLDDETMHHQCILAEIGQPPLPTGTAPYAISNNAVFRNMEYSDLSTSSMPATISLKGLKDALGEAKDRDVYFYVEPHNLPAHGDKPMKLAREDMARLREFAEHPVLMPTKPGKPRTPGKPGENPKPAPDALKPKAPVAKPAPDAPKPRAPVAKAAPDAPKPKTPEAPKGPEGAPAQGVAKIAPEVLARARFAQGNVKFANGLPMRHALAMTGDQLMDTMWPTYRVRPYVDSGKTHTVGTVTEKVLIPLVPFGLRFRHDGSLYGFTHALGAPAGMALTQVSPNWYKLTMKSESTIVLTPTITAQEEPKTKPVGVTPPEKCPTCEPHPQGCTCRIEQVSSKGLGVFSAVAALGLAAFVRRRRSRKH